MGQLKYGIRRKVNYNMLFKLIQIILDSVDTAITLLLGVLKKLSIFGKLVFMIV